MTDQEPFLIIANLARRLRSDAGFMSYVLAEYQKQESLTDEDLVRELDTLPTMVVRLALCKRPASSSGQFAKEVSEIADYTLTDEAQLANILRQVDGLEKLAERSTGLAGSGSEEQSRRPLAGLLAAARDREEPVDQDTSASDDEEKPRHEA
jgi:hypothetical protein